MKAPIANPALPNSNPQGTDSEMLDNLRRATFDYFRNEIDPRTGLIADKTQPGSPSSIAPVGMESPTFPVDPQGYRKWISTFEWRKVYDIECLYAGPLFIHQMSHLWLDFRGIHDHVNRKRGIDYFENSRRATYVQQQYGIANPLGFAHDHKFGRGLTASDGPGPAVLDVNGGRRVFFDYDARGAPFGPDDGTISPWQ
jgi:hypothetical protein